MEEKAKQNYCYAGVVCKAVVRGKKCRFTQAVRRLDSATDTDWRWFGDAPRLIQCTGFLHEEHYTRDDLVIWEFDFEVGFGLGLSMDKARFGNP
jgi:hypothetical protein